MDVRVDADGGFTPTPVVSHAILTHNRGRRDGLADGIVVTPSHNPPRDGGFKYNPPTGALPTTDVTAWIESKATGSIAAGLERRPARALREGSQGVDDAPAPVPPTHMSRTSRPWWTWTSYVARVFASAPIPSGARAWRTGTRSRERYGLDLDVVNHEVDRTFRFMTVDRDGQIRMDPSSPYAMARLVELKDRFDVAFAADTDADRHGIVTRSQGLMEPNHYLSAAIAYLFANRPQWPTTAAVGKTLVSSSMIDRVAARLGRRVVEVPVGFKWFVEGLLGGASGSAAKRARARRSCAATERSGRPTRTGSCRTCSPPRSRRAPARTRANITGR